MVAEQFSWEHRSFRLYVLYLLMKGNVWDWQYSYIQNCEGEETFESVSFK